LTNEQATAYYYAIPDIRSRNSDEQLSAVFTVKAGANCVERPIAGGSVTYGFLKGDAPIEVPSTEQARPPPKYSVLTRLSWIVAAVLIVIFVGLIWNDGKLSGDGQQSQEDQEAFLR
jgi:hypothetical protein